MPQHIDRIISQNSQSRTTIDLQSSRRILRKLQQDFYDYVLALQMQNLKDLRRGTSGNGRTKLTRDHLLGVGKCPLA